MAVAQKALLPTPSERQPSLSATLLTGSQDHSPRPARKSDDTRSTLQAPSCKPTQSPPQKELRKHAKGGARERKQVKRATAKVTCTLRRGKRINEGNSERQSELYGLTGRVLPLPTMPLPHDQAATECPAFQHAPNGP